MTMLSISSTVTRTRLATSARFIHASLVRRDLIGPPDPISHLRPVIYDDAPPSPPLEQNHPYSLREFRGDTREYQWKMQRQELDAFNQAFWRNSNLRFEQAKQNFLSSLPESCTPEEREFALLDFYKGWLNQETARQEEYAAEWRTRNYTNIVLGARVWYQKFMARFKLSKV